ncbi:MAG: response regulator transcription factor [Herpetosiphonaceae bacterium]|nr:response regulator transcription factor [Herpetosiphonaceae bacterium]
MPNTEGSMAIRVLLADDHAVVRKGVREFLEEEPDITVVGEVSDGLQAVDQAVVLRPDVVVMDIAMPGLSGIEATRRIRSLVPEVRVMALTAYDEDPYIFGLLDAGVTGYVLKTAESREVVRAVRATAMGRSTLDPSVAARIAARASQSPSTAEPLTDRELAVLHLAARGLTNKQIGVELVISDRTVQNHLANTYAKLAVASRTEAVTVALQRGLIQLRG